MDESTLFLALGLAFATGIAGLVCWAAVLRPRWRTQAFRDAGQRLRAQVGEIHEAPPEYADRRDLAEVHLGRARELRGLRLSFPPETGPFEVDHLWVVRKTSEGTKRREVLVAWAMVTGGPILSVQKSSALSKAMFQMAVGLLPGAARAARFVETGTALDEGYQVMAPDPEAARASLGAVRVQALRAASDALAELTGRDMGDQVIQSGSGFGFLIQDPPGRLLEEAGLRELLEALGPLSAQGEPREHAAG